MPHSAKTKSHAKEIKGKDKLSDEGLLDLVQRQTFRYFWDSGEPVSGLARDRVARLTDPPDHDIATGGSGFGLMALIVACERGWVTRTELQERVSRGARLPRTSDLLPWSLPPFHAWRHGGDEAVQPQGRWR